MSSAGQGDTEPVVTKEMVGLFVAFGADLVLLVVLLAVVGAASWTVALGVTALVFVIFGGWVGHRWRRLRGSGDGTTERSTEGESTDPLGTLKARYAAGELSDEEFEQKLDQLLESNRQAERSVTAVEDSQAATSAEDESLEERR